MKNQYRLRYSPIQWVEQMAADPQKPWISAFGTNSPNQTLIASCLSALTRELYDDLKRLPVEQRRSWAEYIAGHQSSADGMFYDPFFSEEDLVQKQRGVQYLQWQFAFFSLAALNALDAQPSHPLHFLDEFVQLQPVERWLAGQDWSDPWMVSNRIMFIVSFLIHEWECGRKPEYEEVVRRVFDWLDVNQNPATGFWDLGGGASAHNLMAGAFHFYFFYFYLGRKVNFPQEIIDNTLALQHTDGLYSPRGGGGACLDLDAIDILVKFSLLVDYRAADIKSSLTRSFETILQNQNHDGGFCEAHRTPVWQKSRKRKLIEFFGVDRLLNRPWQGGPIEHQMFSGWLKMRHRVDESELWSAWFRPLSLALISDRYPGEFIDDIPWRFHQSAALGWHDRHKLEALRRRFYA